MTNHPSHFFVLSLCLATVVGGCKPVFEPETTPAVTSTEPAKAETAVTVEHVDAAAASDLVDGNADLIVLDVRTPKEFAEGHIQGALNIDFTAPGFRDEVAKLDPSKEYLLHCQSGRRSAASLPVFETHEFTGVYHLDGGFKAWREAGNAFVTE